MSTETMVRHGDGFEITYRLFDAEFPVRLTIDGCPFDLVSDAHGYQRHTIHLPTKVAFTLGIITAKERDEINHFHAPEEPE